MNCPNCGNSNLDTASLCANCGRALTNATPHSYTPPPPPPSQTSYTPPRPPGGGSFGVPPPAQVIPNYLIQSIFVTVCCCLPLGVVAIVFAAQVNSKLAAGDVAGALEASSKAKLFCWIAFGLGLVVSVIWMVFGGMAFIEGIREGMANR